MGKKLVMMLMTALFLMVVTACSSGQEGGGSSEGNSKETSKADGDLNFYTSQPDADAEKLIAAFNEEYPDVTVNMFRSGTEEVISKIQAEHQAGSVQADVLLVADAVTFKSLKEQNLLLSYESTEHKEIPNQFVDSDYTYSGTKVMTTALAVNTEKVSDVPDSWQAITNENAKGEAVMPSPLYSGAAAYNLGVLTRDNQFGWDFYEMLNRNEVMVTKGNGAALKEVISGNKSYAMVVDFVVARAEQEGSPVKLVYPNEGVPAITEPIAILKDAKNEEAAKAFVDFVLSEKGQSVQAEIGYTPIRAGIDAPEGLKTIDELNIIESDLNELYKSREEDKQQFSDLAGE
ncbi:ABC transporter substrate-binding protein [Pontibacillus litoralis]|uniref:Iron ABC transporter substrate-binding protein n=1 Tax=Pontibacillus litoralis JSM 072002 TaxID=1385512 RepID=A0A0A5G0V4_9BACI|nr:ABC transporter substrate-binding protein [Pontibacillus litoralis]KGX86741.1 iron ABC transporter substrate-binding protein [Pontibacillus litoralis JSM 072002]